MKDFSPYLNAKNIEKEQRVFKLDPSFLAILSTKDEEVKSSFVQVKNAILKYKAGTFKVSHKHVNITIGKYFKGQLAFRKEDLVLYTFIDNKWEGYYNYIFNLNIKNKGELDEVFPTFLRLNNLRQARNAVEVIDICAHKNKRIVLLDEPILDSVKNYPEASDEKLLNDGLTNLILNGKKLDLIPRNKDEKGLEALKNRAFVLSKSYLAKLHEADDTVREDYLQIINTLLCYNEGLSKIYFKKEALLCKGKIFGYLEFKGKTLNLLLPFEKDSKEAKKFKLTPVKREGSKFPTFIKLNTRKSIEVAVQIINLFFISQNITELDKQFEPFTLEDLPKLSTEELLNLEAIKLTINKAKIDDSMVNVRESDIKKLNTATSEEIAEQDQEENTEDYFVDMSDDVITATITKNGKLVATGIDPVVEVNVLKNLSIFANNSKNYKSIFEQDDIQIQNGYFELKKDYFLRAIDEAWVDYIEGAIPFIEKLIKNPRRILSEEEEVVLASQAKKVTSKSVRHLLQHVENINNIEADGTVVPTKLLNVYYEETIKTYENKFLNTLILKLFTFVNRRYEVVKKELENEVRTSLHLEEDFIHKNAGSRGRIKLEIEYYEEPKERLEFKNYVFNSDVWGRVEKVNKSTMYLYNSNFCQEMGKDYIRGSVLRTNAILKNPDLYQCLLLYQFLDSYESAGYRMMVNSKVVKPNDEFYKNFTSSLAKRYMTFVNNIKENKNGEEIFDDLNMDSITPKIVEKAVEPEEGEFDELVEVKKDSIDVTAFEKTLEDALEVALEADKILEESHGKEKK